MDCSLPGSSVHEIFPVKRTGVGCRFLLQGIFPTQGSNPGLPPLDGRDWQWEKLGLVLVGRALLSKALVQLSSDGWGCTPSLVVVWPEATQPWGL